MKEKKRIEQEQEKIYYYEITGTIVILFSLITFSELGFVGTGLKSLLKILFGDYYFIIIIYTIYSGIKALVKKTWFDITSIKFNGFILFVMSLITLNHIGFYQRLGFQSTEIFTKTISTYTNVLKNLIHINSYGGGVLGALLLQILIYLFNTLGTLIILIVLMILSLSFMTNISYKTVLYYINIVVKKIRNIFLILYKYFNNISLPTKTIKKAKLNININMLDDVDNKANEQIAIKIASEDEEKIRKYLESIDNYVEEAKVEVGFQTTRYTYITNKMIYEKEKIKLIINSNIIIYEKNNKLIIESGNKIKRLITLKYLLLKTDSIPLGEEINNQIINFDPLEHKNLLLSGSTDTGIKTFIKSMIISYIFKYKYNFKLVIFDIKHEFIELKYMPNLFTPYVNNSSDILSSLDNIAKELERRIDLLNNSGKQDYIEYSLFNEKLEPIIIILNNIDEIKQEIYETKLLYFLKFGFKVGIHFIIVNRTYNVEKEILVNIQTKLLFKCLTSGQSYQLINNNNACFLENKADVILNNKDVTQRIATPYISNKDYDKIISKFIVN